jgi:hypothetical protein
MLPVPPFLVLISIRTRVFIGHHYYAVMFDRSKCIDHRCIARERDDDDVTSQKLLLIKFQYFFLFARDSRRTSSLARE